MDRSRDERGFLALALILVALTTVALGTPGEAASGGDKKKWPRPVEKAFKSIKPKECFEHVAILASDGYEGRECGSEGGRLASEYVAARFREMGLEPGGIEGTFFQLFSVRFKSPKEGPLSLSNGVELWKKKGDRKSTTLEYGEDFVPHPLSREGAVTGHLVYFGEKTPSQSSEEGSTGVEGRVIALVPARVAREDKAYFDELEASGIAGVILLTDDAKAPELTEADWPAGTAEEAASVLVVRLSYDGADRFLKKLGSSVKKLASKPPSGSVLSKAVATLMVSRRGFIYGRGRNVIGIRRGTDPELQKECIVIGAHYDHVGRPSDRRYTNGKVGEIHNGADDNASGTTGIIELAEAFCEHEVETRRSIVFIAFDAEEAGLLGSKYYVADPPVFSIEQTKAMINMDMISRNGAQEMYIGKVDEFAGLNQIVGAVADYFKIHLNPEGMEKYLRRSDQAAFIDAGVPAVFLYGGDHPQYHTEKDDVELINPAKIVNIARLMFLCAYECANHAGSFFE